MSFFYSLKMLVPVRYRLSSVADPDPTFHPDADLDPNPSFQKGSLPWKSAHKGSCSIHFGLSLQIDADPDPAYPFNADLDVDPGPDFYLMRMRISVPKMMRIRIHNTALKRVNLKQRCNSGRKVFFYCCTPVVRVKDYIVLNLDWVLSRPDHHP